MKINGKYKLEKIANTSAVAMSTRHIFIDGDEAVATNGHKMVVIPVERSDDDIKDSVLISVDTWKQFLKFGEMHLTKEGARVGGAVWDYIDEEYPDYRKALKKIIGKDDKIEVSLDPKYLWDIAQAIGSADGVTLRIDLKNDLTAIEVLPGEDLGEIAILMPIRRP